jgi:hypothetical protein
LFERSNFNNVIYFHSVNVTSPLFTNIALPMELIDRRTFLRVPNKHFLAGPS